MVPSRNLVMFLFVVLFSVVMGAVVLKEEEKADVDVVCRKNYGEYNCQLKERFGETWVSKTLNVGGKTSMVDSHTILFLCQYRNGGYKCDQKGFSNPWASRFCPPKMSQVDAKNFDESSYVCSYSVILALVVIGFIVVWIREPQPNVLQSRELRGLQIQDRKYAEVMKANNDMYGAGRNEFGNRCSRRNR
jgi:hypothetical protein